MAVELPDELIVQILSFLPAKSLLRWRSVSKSWLNLISSTKFKAMHLHNFNQLIPRYFVRRMYYVTVEEWYNVHFDDEAFGLDIDTQIEFPFDRSRGNLCYSIIGCCNGVVCLSDDNDDFKEDAFTLDTITLWNPSIRRKLTLPLPIFYYDGFEDPVVVLGFGYDKMSDDFKVVSLTYDWYSSSTRPKVEVYTLKTGFWRELVFPHNLSCFYTQSEWSRIFSNGCVHWICTADSNWSRYSILTFDISTELFGEIQLPEFLAQKHLLKISVVGESLAVILSSGFNFDGLMSGGSTYVVMIMKEYNNPASWTTLYHIHYPDLNLGKPLRLRNKWDVIAELKNRDIIMFNHSEGSYVYVLLDCEDEEENSDDKTYVDRYVESLALLDVGDSVPNKEAMKALMMIENQGTLPVDDKSVLFAFQSESVSFSLWHEGLGDPSMTTVSKIVSTVMLVDEMFNLLAFSFHQSATSNEGIFALIDSSTKYVSTCKICVMKEYKNPTSWTLIYNMHYLDIDMGKALKPQNKRDMIMEPRDGNIIVYNYSGYAYCICPRYEYVYVMTTSI
ncbi:hypothetical protein OSB04_013421 [Centaurea solstitialis]|uniref:F-box domain-containing protein n=1 Tax=Centaurea solstitialis TaxID=347529 RepID=A0AA38TWA1_9ASTR|nr:hypothetical protein OSB04_013421 [Centaurea solstitialis]